MKEKLYKMPKEHRDLCRKFDKDARLPKGTTQRYGEFVHYVQDEPEVEDCRTKEEIIQSLTRFFVEDWLLAHDVDPLEASSLWKELMDVLSHVTTFELVGIGVTEFLLENGIVEVDREEVR
jgi:hypothetical protein